MDLLIHYSDFEQFVSALKGNLADIYKDTIYATTRWTRGMPLTSVTVEAVYVADGNLHRFTRYLGEFMDGGGDKERMDGLVEELHARIREAARKCDLIVLPGRVQLVAELGMKGGAL